MLLNVEKIQNKLYRKVFDLTCSDFKLFKRPLIVKLSHDCDFETTSRLQTIADIVNVESAILELEVRALTDWLA